MIYIVGNPSECSTTKQVQSLCAYSNGLSALSINNLPVQVEEGDSLMFVVKTDYPTLDGLTVNFLTSNATELLLPASVIIPAGKDSIIIKTLLPDDNTPEEDETITITANALYLQSDSKSFILTNNNDIPSIELEIFQDSVAENIGLYQVQGVLRRLSNNTNPLTINLQASQSGLLLPNQISMIPGQTEEKFTIGVLDNTLIDGFRKLTITAKVLIPSCNCEAANNSTGVTSDELVIIDNDGAALNLIASPVFLKEGVAEAGTLTIERNTTTTSDFSRQFDCIRHLRNYITCSSDDTEWRCVCFYSYPNQI